MMESSLVCGSIIGVLEWCVLICMVATMAAAGNHNRINHCI